MKQSKIKCIRDCSACCHYWRNECDTVKKYNGSMIYVQLSLFDFDGNKIISKCEK